MVELFVNNEKIKERIRFPITEAGSKSIVIARVENPLDEFVELIPFVGDKDVQIQDYPKKLKPYEKGKAVWIFSPKEGRRRSLNCECGFKEILG